MRMRIIAAVTILALGVAGTAAAEDLEAVGIVTATQGTVMMQPATMRGLVPVGLDDQVGPLALFETQAGSRCKVLYTDDTLLTLGEQSRLEVTEQTYRAGSDSRAFVAHLIRGSVRALVGRQFPGDNSVFEIHSGTTVATARGTYFVLWSEQQVPATGGKETSPGGRIPGGSDIDDEGRTGVANIGQAGNVAFTSAGATVLVLPGQFSIALPGSPPTMPAALRGGVSPVAAAISGTALTEAQRPESPRAALAAVGLGGEVAGRAPDTGPRVAKPGPLAGPAPSGSYMLPDWPWPVTPVTPPAVASGAVVPSTTLNLVIRLP